MANYKGSDNSLPKHLILNYRNLFDQKVIANSFNEYFANVGPKLACETPQLQRSFEMYFKESDSSFEKVTLSGEEIKTTFFSLKVGWFSIFVMISAQDTKKRGPVGFWLISKTGWTPIQFSCLIWQKYCCLWLFSAQSDDVRGSPPAYHHLVVCRIYFQ